MQSKIIAALVVALLSLSGLFYAESLKLDSAREKLDRANQDIAAYNLEKSELNQKISDLSYIGKKSNEELKSAKAEIDNLERDLDANRKRLYVKASCPSGLSKATTPGSLGDGKTARLTESARQDYLRLKRMIVEERQKITYLQDYINTQCK